MIGSDWEVVKVDIEIRRLTPDLAEDYVHFFDTTPHSDNIDDHKCYCVCWCNDDYEGRDFSTPEKRRAYAIQYVKGSNIQGYLAYRGDEVVGVVQRQCESGLPEMLLLAAV